MNKTRYQILFNTQKKFRSLFYSKESFITIIKNITLFYVNYEEYYSITSKNCLAFYQNNFDTLVLDDSICGNLNNMGVEFANFCFYQGLIQIVMPIFVKTMKNTLIGWH
jgi:hypothetical protein